MDAGTVCYFRWAGMKKRRLKVTIRIGLKRVWISPYEYILTAEATNAY